MTRTDRHRLCFTLYKPERYDHYSRSAAQRLTLAHELGHVVMHVNSIPALGVDEEDEAFRFAIEFLMPINECQYDLTEKLSIEKLADLKRIWKVSMQAILYRAQKQNLVSYNRARYLWSQMSARGWRKSEPIEVLKERPTLISRMIRMFIDQLEYSKDEIARMFRLNIRELDSRYFKQPSKLRVA